MRKAGVLMPVSALPSAYGIGALGRAAREFLDFLQQAGQSCWQILPLCQTGYRDSPYQSVSTYAGNPYFIDLDELALWGLLQPEEYQHIHWGDDPAAVDYGLLYEKRFPVLALACGRLEARFSEEFAQFCQQNSHWLEDYALFMALKSSFHDTAWSQWPPSARLREAGAMEQARHGLSGEIALWRGIQFLFFRQWTAIRAEASRRGIAIIGDIPIYVAEDSADVWANPAQFQLDDQCMPISVAGCPPDGFCEDGQLWGNPLFRWDTMAQDGYAWWLRRLEFQFQQYDSLRIDHFRGFESYYAIPYGQDTARNGRWEAGPGLQFFQAVHRALGARDIIAEDLGFLTDSVRELLRETGYPGMKVLQFAFDSRAPGNEYLPHRHVPHCVVYTGTHDNDTICGWMESAPTESVAYAKEYLRLHESEGWHWGMMRSAWASPANLAVVTMQDLLGLDSRARMNIPATTQNNWQWRMLPGQCTPALARRVAHEMQVYQRIR